MKMKRQMAVLAYYVRSTVYKVLLLLTAMVSVETVLFYRNMQRLRGESLERLIKLSWAEPLFLFSFLALGVILVYSSVDRGGSKPSYTMERLQLSKANLFFLRAGYFSLCFALLFAVQIMTAAAMGIFYQSSMGEEYAHGQTVF